MLAHFDFVQICRRCCRSGFVIEEVLSFRFKFFLCLFSPLKPLCWVCILGRIRNCGCLKNEHYGILGS